MGVKIAEKEYKNYGKCVFLENGAVTLGATVEFGPRVIYFSLDGKPNIMFEDTERRFKEKAGEYGEWVAYGGHRLWCAPEINPETYYPDNDSVEYAFDGKTLTLRPHATSFGKKFEIDIEMDDSKPLVKLRHRIVNVSDTEAEFAAWSITSLTGGVCLVPMSKKKTGYLPNRVMSLWDYSDVHDSRVTFENTFTVIRQDPAIENAFKAGFNVEDGFIACAVKGQLFAKCFSEYENVVYPDYSCNAEVYTNGMFLESELVGEMKKYAPDAAAEISEQWCIFEHQDDSLSEPDKYLTEIECKIKEIL